jgi:hypothetical protein
MSAFSQFDVAGAIDFFNSLGVKTKEEAEGRVFPVSDKAQTILDALIKYMKNAGAEIKTGEAVSDIFFDKKENNVIIRLKKGETLIAKSCIIATGGTSHPVTGSTGDGFLWLKKMGHKIVKNDSALVPLAIKNNWVKELSGVSLTDIKLTALLDEKKQFTQKGKILFTHFGVSGPTILNMSRKIGDLLHHGSVVIALDLFPDLDHGALKQKLQNILISEKNKKIKNALGGFIHSAFVPVMLAIAGVNDETPCRDIRREDRKNIIDCAKALRMDVAGLLGADKAVVSSGGVALQDVDFKTMRSRVVSRIFLVGDTLDIDRPSGGYSLQLCWTTGFIAGENA